MSYIQKVFVIILVFVCFSIGGHSFQSPVFGTGSSASPDYRVTENFQYSGDTYVDNVTGMQFVFVKGGCFQMGDILGEGKSNEKPIHEVCLDDYYIGKYEVTQGQWKTIMGSDPSSDKSCGDDCPVERVDWNKAMDFVLRFNARSGVSFNLPTEAQWEYAARSRGQHHKFSGGGSIDSVGWYKANSGGRKHRVGQKEPNALGVYDMTGNVWEWCRDTFSDSAYSSHSRRNPFYEGSGNSKSMRGGSYPGVDGNYLRNTYRWGTPATTSHDYLGLRLVIPVLHN